MTASKLGKKVGVSESTVVRFAVELGYDGYPSMQKAIQEMVLNRLTSVQRIEVANDRMEGQDVVSTVLRADAEKLRQTEELLDRQEFAKAVQAILDTDRVYILGVRSAAPLANFLGYYLRYLSDNVQSYASSHTKVNPFLKHGRLAEFFIDDFLDRIVIWKISVFHISVVVVIPESGVQSSEHSDLCL